MAFQSPMDRAGKLIRSLKLPGECIDPEDVVRAAWIQAVGPRIGAHARAVALAGRRLVVEVEDAVWQRQLQTLAPRILAKLAAVAGSECVAAIEFRTGLPRRQPQRAESTRPSRDEADAIADPVLRRLYIAARNRSAV